METLDLDTIAREIKTAQDEAVPMSPPSSRLSGFDIDAGYAVEQQLHQLRLNEGAVPVARKIGFTNPAAWTTLGVSEPVWAYIYNTTFVQISGTDVVCPIGRLLEPRIEPEIMFHFRSAPPVTDDLAAILACVDWIAHGFEIVQSRFAGWKFKPADAIADGVLHGALLVGERHDVGQFGADLIATLEQFTVPLSCDGQVREVGKGTNVLGSPLLAIAKLLAILARQGAAPVQAGELITTGSLTAALPIHVGETWTTELSGLALPGLTIHFVA